MAKFFDNLRRATTAFNKSNGSSTGVSSWDPELISETLEARWAGLDKSESPMLSLNVDIPRTPSVIKIQTGKYKLNNDTNVTGINNDNALHIVGTTYQDNDDGTHYGMGWDGRPYSYTIKNSVVGDFTPLGIDEQKKAVKRLTDGKISVHETITNPATLAEIYRSIKRMKDNGNGNLIPDHVVIGDSDPSRVSILGEDGTMGVARRSEGSAGRPDHIDLRGSNFPSAQAWKSNMGKQLGWFSANGGDSLAQHELAHTAEYALLDSPQRYYDRVAEDAKKYKGKYSAGDLWDDAIGKIKYALPVLMDAVFGTHFVPSKDEMEAMYASNRINDNKTAEYWEDYYTPLEYKYNTVEEKMKDAANKKSSEWADKYVGEDDWDAQNNLFRKAARNAGFESVEDAVASVSEYATTDNSEAFAEAYSDVLLNGAQAKPFSKELIKIYSEAADDATKMFGKNKKPVQLQVFNQLIDVLPDFVKNDPAPLNQFQNNFQRYIRK